jgi:hypothetical protein
VTRRKQTVIGIVAALCILIAIVLVVELNRHRAAARHAPVTLVGNVLKQDSDPAQQTPLADVLVSASASSGTQSVRSGPTGLFSVTLNPGPEKGESVILTFKQAAYKPLRIVATRPGDQLYIARMEPLQPEAQAALKSATTPAKAVELNNIRVRYTVKEQSTVNVGSLAKLFTVHNLGNVPCRGRPPCSPDGRWAASRTDLPLDAEDGNEFRNVRVLCVAGPCAFTQVLLPNTATPKRTFTVSVLNWSDTAVFLVEAEVIRTMVTDAVQYVYPFIVGSTMNFALPSGSEGPSIEADLDGQYVVFPLGPLLNLAWASCTVEVSQQGNKNFRCQLKPGYRMHE